MNLPIFWLLAILISHGSDPIISATACKFVMVLHKGTKEVHISFHLVSVQWKTFPKIVAEYALQNQS